MARGSLIGIDIKQQSLCAAAVLLLEEDYQKCDDSLVVVGWLTKLQTGDVYY
jgi:hypothetical protein